MDNIEAAVSGGQGRITGLGQPRECPNIVYRLASVSIQNNSSTSSLETDARLRWEYTPGSDLFVVYTDGRDTTYDGFPGLLKRSMAVKLKRLFRF